MPATKEQIRQIISENNITSVADVYTLSKDSFKDILQEFMDPVYPFVFMDCIHYKVREDGKILSRAAYIVLGVAVGGFAKIFL